LQRGEQNGNGLWPASELSSFLQMGQVEFIAVKG
jgi:hypothetical protein